MANPFKPGDRVRIAREVGGVYGGEVVTVLSLGTTIGHNFNGAVTFETTERMRASVEGTKLWIGTEFLELVEPSDAPELLAQRLKDYEEGYHEGFANKPRKKSGVTVAYKAGWHQGCFDRLSQVISVQETPKKPKRRLLV